MNQSKPYFTKLVTVTRTYMVYEGDMPEYITDFSKFKEQKKEVEILALCEKSVNSYYARSYALGKIDEQQWQQMSPAEKNDFLFDEGVYKMIAEVSKKAKWIKPGIEFSKEEIKLSEYPQCPKCGAISNDGFCPEEIECEIGNARTVAYFYLEQTEDFH